MQNPAGTAFRRRPQSQTNERCVVESIAAAKGLAALPPHVGAQTPLRAA